MAALEPTDLKPTDLKMERRVIPGTIETVFEFDYSVQAEDMRSLYEKAKRDQWNASRDIAWDTGKNPKGQRLFKIKGNRIYVGSRYDSGGTDTVTIGRIIPNRTQGLMMKKDAKGNVSYFYQDGLGTASFPATAHWATFIARRARKE
jgi:hypothetical protein